MSVFTDARKSFKKKQRQAYRTARRELEQQIVGERVRLTYPYEEGTGSFHNRMPKVEGTVASVDTGTIMEEGIEFTAFVELENGSIEIENEVIDFEDTRTFVDPDDIEIL